MLTQRSNTTPPRNKPHGKASRTVGRSPSARVRRTSAFICWIDLVQDKDRHLEPAFSKSRGAAVPTSWAASPIGRLDHVGAAGRCRQCWSTCNSFRPIDSALPSECLRAEVGQQDPRFSQIITKHVLVVCFPNAKKVRDWGIGIPESHEIPGPRKPGSSIASCASSRHADGPDALPIPRLGTPFRKCS